MKDEGYMSTSTNKAVAEDFARGGVVFKMKLPAGEGAPVFDDGSTAYLGESEIVAKRGGGMRILSVTKDPKGHTIVEADYIPASKMEKKK